MKKAGNNIFIGFILVISSAFIYFLQIKLFHDSRNTFFYLFQDMAFLPLQVFIVTLILEQILSAREKRDIIRKLNVVISAFYSEVGTQAISELSGYVIDIERIKYLLNVEVNWTERDFKAAVKNIKSAGYDMRSEKGNLILLKDFLIEKKSFMLSMFENTNLLEHDAFTDMLWAVFHVCEELQSRDSLEHLPEGDLEHLSGDIKRAYQLLIVEWLRYMNHLKDEYPYLFSLAIRKSPFSEEASVIIK